MATGKPVVSSGFTNFGEFEDFMHIYDENNSVTHAVESALRDKDIKRQQLRVELASENTWENRIQGWEDIISQLA